MRKPLLITIPHSGERVPEETPWLLGLPERLLMFDVDRYVDRLYEPAIRELSIASVKTEWHRYAVDLNRWKDDVDCDSVQGHANPSGRFPRGLHWSITTTKEKLMPGPMSPQIHELLVKKYFEPFHEQVRNSLSQLRAAGAATTYHIDAHSMPSMGTNEHRDPGQRRPDVVISDCEARSCSEFFRELVTSSYQKAGFSTGYNWPYKGGRVTETYGRPDQKQEAIQVELNRSLYMDEQSKGLLSDRLSDIQARLKRAIEAVHAGLPDLP